MLGLSRLIKKYYKQKYNFDGARTGEGPWAMPPGPINLALPRLLSFTGETLHVALKKRIAHIVQGVVSSIIKNKLTS